MNNSCACVLGSWGSAYGSIVVTLVTFYDQCYCCRKWQRAALVVWPHCHSQQLLCDSGQAPAVTVLNNKTYSAVWRRRQFAKAAAQLTSVHAGAVCLTSKTAFSSVAFSQLGRCNLPLCLLHAPCHVCSLPLVLLLTHVEVYVFRNARMQ